jgi:hypothetical protein
MFMATYKRWNEAELQYIKDNLSSFSDNELANKLSEMTGETVTTGMIRRQRRKIGVSKPRGRRKKSAESSST